MKQEWKPIEFMPSDGKFYLTKIDDANGVRNIAELRKEGNLFFEQSGIYVYYTPTHFFN